MSKTIEEPIKILPRERNAIIRSQANGEVPSCGLRHLVVGREAETKALITDLDAIRRGESSFRIIAGPNGIGKTFLHTLASLYAVEGNLVVVYAHLTTEHRFHGRDGRGKELYSTLISNLRTKSSSGTNGFEDLLEGWVSRLQGEGADQSKISEKLQQVRESLGAGFGQDYAHVLAQYQKACSTGDVALEQAAFRWLSAGYSTKAEARKALGVERIITDRDVFVALKMLAKFCRVAGYDGLLVIFDELGNLTNRLSDTRAREANLGCILEMMCESLQTNSGAIGIIFAGLTESVTHPEKGLFSSAALRTRLKQGDGGFTAPKVLISLTPLRHEEILQLLQNIIHVWALGIREKYLLPEEGIRLFLEKYFASAEKNSVITPREVVVPFIEILFRLEENPEAKWHEVIETHPMKKLKQ